MTDSLLTGRCFCGTVRYRCAAPLYPPTLCHCESCRRVAGAHAVAWLTVPAGSLSYPMAKPVEAPAPQVTMAMRTEGSGSSITSVRSLAEA